MIQIDRDACLLERLEGVVGGLMPGIVASVMTGENYYSVVQAGVCEPLLDTIKHLHVSALSKSSTEHVMVVMLWSMSNPSSQCIIRTTMCGGEKLDLA